MKSENIPVAQQNSSVYLINKIVNVSKLLIYALLLLDFLKNSTNSLEKVLH